MSDSYIIDVQSNKNSMLLTFPQNMPNNIEQLVKDSQLYQQIKLGDPSKQRKAIKLESNKITWVGKSQLNQQNEPQFMIGLLGAERGDNVPNNIKLYPCISNFQMEQFIHKQMGTGQSLLTGNIADKKLSHFEQQVRVAEAMGTSKSKKKMRAMQTNRVDQENISHANQIQQVFESRKEELKEKEDEEKLEIKQIQMASKLEILPQFNMNLANDPTNFYNIESIVSEQDLEAINITGIFVAITKKPENLESASKRFGQYARDTIMELLESIQQKDNTQKTLSLKYIVFLDSMIKFLNQKKFFGQTPEAIAQKLKICDPIIVKSILQKFYVATSGNVSIQKILLIQKENLINYNRNKDLGDKLICYIIVLTLWIYDFQFEPTRLISLFQFKLDKFILYCKQCHCIVKHPGNENGKMIVKLQPKQEKTD